MIDWLVPFRTTLALSLIGTSGCIGKCRGAARIADAVSPKPDEPDRFPICHSHCNSEGSL